MYNSKPVDLLYNSLILSHLNFCVLALGYQCGKLIKVTKTCDMDYLPQQI